jgi:hypothetical protein
MNKKSYTVGTMKPKYEWHTLREELLDEYNDSGVISRRLILELAIHELTCAQLKIVIQKAKDGEYAED